MIRRPAVHAGVLTAFSWEGHLRVQSVDRGSLHVRVNRFGTSSVGCQITVCRRRHRAVVGLVVLVAEIVTKRIHAIVWPAVLLVVSGVPLLLVILVASTSQS